MVVVLLEGIVEVFLTLCTLLDTWGVLGDVIVHGVVREPSLLLRGGGGLL